MRVGKVNISSKELIVNASLVLVNEYKYERIIMMVMVIIMMIIMIIMIIMVTIIVMIMMKMAVIEKRIGKIYSNIKIC